MSPRLLPLAAVLAAALALPAVAHEYKLGALTIDHPYSRATTAPNGAAYMMIANNGREPDRLLRGSSPQAAKVELHTIMREGDVMKMREVPAIDVPAGGKAELRPGGFHVMLLGLKGPLREGEKFNLNLEFEKAGKVEVTVQIDKAGASGGHGHPAPPPAKAP
ncbi:MAG: copper chaperone PCu(A)C [Alphaproteobacteria bacterium]|nr:copper chaperone PCu(A)C [Alphaproteobacteria bacterium]